MKCVIGVVGENGAGKDTFTTFFRAAAAPHEVAKVRFSDILSETLDLWGIEKSRANLQNMAIIMDRKFGVGSLTRATKSRIERKKADITIVEGIRWKQDVPMIKSFSDSFIIYITAKPKVRYERMKARSDKAGEAKKTYVEFEKEERAATEVEISQIGKNADYRIENNGSIDEFRKNVEKFYKDYLHSPK